VRPSTPSTDNEGDVRDRIFQSALRNFSQKGYAATSLREVAEDAGTTKPMIYYYFGSKEGLYGNIVRDILEEMADAIRSHLPEAAPDQQIVAYCERYLDHFLAKEEIIALVLREVFGLGGVPMAQFSQALAEQVRQPLDTILRHGMEVGALQADSVSMCANAITGILNMYILAHVFGGADIDREGALRQVGYYICGLERARSA
jgi:TetR/AcrR family transcriptional regulator